MSAFLLLHEATAIIPLPIVYYALASSSIEAPAVAPEMLQEATVRMKKMLDRMDSTWTVSQQSANVLFHMASAYCIVKSLFPLRIALSVALTPTIAKLSKKKSNHFIETKTLID